MSYKGFSVFPEALLLVVADLAAAGTFNYLNSATNERGECPIGALCRLTGIANGTVDREGRQIASLAEVARLEPRLGVRWEEYANRVAVTPGFGGIVHNLAIARIGSPHGRDRRAVAVSLIRFAHKHDRKEIADYHRALGVRRDHDRDPETPDDRHPAGDDPAPVTGGA